MRAQIAAALFAIASMLPTSAHAQVYPPGTCGIDGYPAVCGSVTFILNPQLNDVGQAQPGVVYLNPNVLAQMSTSMKLFFGQRTSAATMLWARMKMPPIAGRSGRDEIKAGFHRRRFKK